MFNLINTFYYNKKGNRIIPVLKTVPQRLWDLIRFEMVEYNIYLSENEKKFAHLRNKHVGKRCFILGNGPSLRIEDLDKLKSEITFAANKIYLAFDKTNWRPTYYAVTDGLVAKQNYLEIENLSGFTKFFPSKAKTSWGTPFSDAIYFRYIHYTNRYPKPPGFGLNPLHKIYAGRTVLYAFIQICCFMGIREIYLLGVDFNFSEPLKKKGRIFISEGESNHFHPNYRNPGEKWAEPKLHFQKKAFEEAGKAVENMDGRVFNATRGGKLEVFPRVNFNELF